MNFDRCAACAGRILIVPNRCEHCGRLDSVWTALAAKVKRRRHTSIRRTRQRTQEAAP